MKPLLPTPWLSALALVLGLGAGAASTPALLSARTGPPVALEAATPPAAAPAEVHLHGAPSLWRPVGSNARRPPVRVAHVASGAARGMGGVSVRRGADGPRGALYLTVITHLR